MIDRLTKVLSINERTSKTARKFLPFVNEHGDEITDAVVYDLLRDSEVVSVLNKRKAKLPVIKAGLKYWLRLVFSGNYDEEFYKEIYNIGCTHVDVGVEAHLVMEAVALFNEKTVQVLSKYTEISRDELLEIVKLFHLADIIMVNSYGDELIAAFLQFTGLRKELFMKEVELARKVSGGTPK